MDDAKQKKVDRALDQTFPASDPPASNQATGTEPPARPASRQAPLISKEQIEAAAGADRRSQQRRARKRHRGVGQDGLHPGDAIDAGDDQGLGRAGVEPKPRRQE
jgi:hypothetical protein